MYLIQSGANNKELQLIAKEFYGKLNPKKKGSTTWHKNSLRVRIRKAKNHSKSNLEKYFFELLSKENYDLLKKLVTGYPKDLDEVIRLMDRLINDGKIPPFFFVHKGKMESTDFGERVLNVFNYRRNRSSLRFAWWVKELDNKICPYCNYEYTFVAESADESKILHDVDHYISKVKAPYLSLSFFNLIPSCHICNSHYKLDQEVHFDTHIHPYQDDFDSLKSFTIDGIVIDENNLNTFDITFKNCGHDPTNKSDKHIELFGLLDRYKNFKDKALKIHRIKTTYSEAKKLELLNPSDPNLPTISSSDALLKLISQAAHVPQNKKEAMRISAGKLEFDLAQELKIFE